MERYDFEVVKGQERVVVASNVAIPDSGTMWRRIAAIARNMKAEGQMIRVTNGAGIVVLIGIVAALQLCADLLANPPPL